MSTFRSLNAVGTSPDATVAGSSLIVKWYSMRSAPHAIDGFDPAGLEGRLMAKRRGAVWRNHRGDEIACRWPRGGSYCLSGGRIRVEKHLSGNRYWSKVPADH